MGATLEGNLITNIFADDLVTLFYNPALAENAYLKGLVYRLEGGGYLLRRLFAGLDLAEA